MFRPKWIKRKFRSSESLGSRKFEIGGPDFSGHTSMQVTSHYFDSSIGAVGPTAEHLSRHCAHRLSKVMPTDVFLTLHSPVRTTAMRTPSRFYKAPEKKADVAIDSPKWWASKSGTSKTAKNNHPITKYHITIHHFRSVPKFSRDFPSLLPAASVQVSWTASWIRATPPMRFRWGTSGKPGNSNGENGESFGHLLV